MPRPAIVLCALLSVSACKEPGRTAPVRKVPPSRADRLTWPAFPTTLKSARALVKERTRRTNAAFDVLPQTAALQMPLPQTAAALLDLIRQRQRQSWLVAGWDRIVQVLQKQLDRPGDQVLLWGTYHDAGGQLEAFRSLVGPAGLRGLSAVSLEQLAADGRWGGVAGKEQRGISKSLARYLETGKREALESVGNDQRRTNYTGWKYRHLGAVTDLLLTARAAGLRLLPCDMPGALQRRSQGEVVDRLRELHCLLTLEQALQAVPRPHRVAMAWGQGHLARTALPRFLPPETRVLAVYVYGHRPGPAGLEHEVKGRLLLTDPALLRLDEGRYLLLLDGPVLGGRLERALDRLERALPEHLRHQLRVTARANGQLQVAGQRVTLKAEQSITIPVSPGGHSYLFEGANKTLVGSVEIVNGGSAELTLDAVKGETRLLLRQTGL